MNQVPIYLMKIAKERYRPHWECCSTAPSTIGPTREHTPLHQGTLACAPCLRAVPSAGHAQRRVQRERGGARARVREMVRGPEVATNTHFDIARKAPAAPAPLPLPPVVRVDRVWVEGHAGITQSLLAPHAPLRASGRAARVTALI